ncbi:hypothetical protein ACWA06_02180 [Serratia rhizosphaerae]|uniref:hypothetical protein n=1 Tax=unclassified Serratia (in: enterobacteria) TaxID=2647522 RepID=UPI000CF6D08A|nr:MULTISPECIES: hypothetical protein [unclassified Serratia (in: enterobacteria)]AVJ17228.1 hypothetical protein CLM71_08835 [Serratia sp. MYb239]QNK30900.1 hypothetical protein HF675_14735 [Serratia sp. JUb9]
MVKLYYSLCGIVFIIGIAMSILSVEFPGSTDSGEMPLAFGAGLDIAFIGIIGFAVGLIAKCLSTMVRKKNR